MNEAPPPFQIATINEDGDIEIVGEIEDRQQLVDFLAEIAPNCQGSNGTCRYPEPHRHGFACDRTCEVCHG